MEAILKKEIILNTRITKVLGVSVFVILTSLGAFVRIPLPFTPVPLTLQTFFVLLGAALLGGRLGTVTQVSYIFLGVLGLPIFSGAGSGFLYLCGPTAGYLAGFIFASLFIGRFIKFSRGNMLFTTGILFSADLILLFCGALWLKFLFGYNLHGALLLGLLPFIPGDLFKAAAAAAIYLKLKARPASA